MKRILPLVFLFLSIKIWSQQVVCHPYSNITVGCAPFTIQFSDSSTGNPTHFSWNFDNGTPIVNTQNIDYTFNFGGTFVVQHIVSNSVSSDTAYLTITVYNQLQVNPGANRVACPGTCVTLSASPYEGAPGAIYSYEWTSSNNTVIGDSSSVSVCPYANTSTYFVTINDITHPNCSASNQVTVTDWCFADSQPSCNGACNGSIRMILADPNDKVKWNNDDSTITITGLCPGYYACTIHDSNDIFIDTMHIQLNALGPVASVDAIPSSRVSPNCNGEANVSVNGGTLPYHFRWNNNDTTQFEDNVCAGTYTVTVTDGTGCSGTASGTVGFSGCQLTAAVSNTGFRCSPPGDSVTLRIHNATLPVTVIWAPLDTLRTVDTVLTNNYTTNTSHFIGIINTGGCYIQVIDSFNSTGPRVTITPTPSSHPNICNGAATANPSGGTAPYHYLWSNNDTTKSISGLCKGTYYVTVFDNNGCSSSATANVTSGSCLLTASITSSGFRCNAVGDTVTLTVHNDLPPLVVNWNNSGSDTIPNSDSVFVHVFTTNASHSVTVYDAVGCSDFLIDTFITRGPSVTTTPTPSSHPNICNGAATANPSGGATPYHYLWSNNDTTKSISGLCKGTYYVTVFDNNGCSSSATANVTSGSCLFTASITSSGFKCNTVGDTVTLMVHNDLPPLYINWNNTVDTINNSDTIFIHVFTTNASHVISVGDAAGCSGFFIDTFITNGPTVSITPTPSSHPEICNGTATANASAGTGPYHYLWSNSDTAKTITGLCKGTYKVTVTDNTGCSSSATANVTSGSCLLTASLTSSGYRCDIIGDTVTVTVHNALLPLTIEWGSIQDSIHYTDTVVTSIFNTRAGHSVVVNDAAGCSVYLIDSMVQDNVNLKILEETEAPCNNPYSGKIKISGQYGYPPYTYLWNTGSTADSIVGPASIYSFTVTDSRACTFPFSIALEMGDGRNFGYNTQEANCSSGGVGVAGVAAYINNNSPTMFYGYSVLWNNGDTNDTIHVPPGTYTFTATDTEGCVFQQAVTVAYSTYGYYVYLNATEPNCGDNGSITTAVSGGEAPYHYLWSNSSTSASISGLGAGDYKVTVTDNGGCITYGSDSLIPQCYNVIIGDVYTDANGNCIQDNGEGGLSNIYVTAVNGSQTYFGSTNASGQFIIDVPDAGTYSLYFDLPGSSHTCTVYSVCNDTTVTFNGVGDTVIRNYGISSNGGYDLIVHPGWYPARPGQQKEYWVIDYNQSNVAFTGTATITFTYDPNLIYQYSYAPLPVHDPVAHTLTWTVTGVPFNLVFANRFQNFFMVPSSLSPSYELRNEFKIEPYAGDCDTLNNDLVIYDVVGGSRDPNEKDVSPTGSITDNDSILTYTIHFQNTGVDTTWFVTVYDTLAPQLDPATVQTVAASLPYNFSLTGKGILQWVFNPAYLPARSEDSLNSQGFVSFTVKKKSGLPIGTVVSNTASIVFDYNNPVATNTARDTVSEGVATVISTTGKGDISVSVFPNPANDKLFIAASGFQPEWVSLYDLNGQRLSEQKFASQIDISALPSGVYFIEAKGVNNAVRNKIVKISGE